MKKIIFFSLFLTLCFFNNVFAGDLILNNNSGNVGIGTSSPSQKLDVNGNIKCNGNISTSTLSYGDGGTRVETKDNAGAIGNAKSGFYQTSNPTNYPTGATSWWHMIEARHSNGSNNYALQIAGSFFDQSLWFRKTNDNATTSWSRIYSTNDSVFNGNITGNAATATNANYATTAGSANSVTWANITGKPNLSSSTFQWNWSGQGGQPNWLWGGNDASYPNMYVYNPSNFSVNYANSAGNSITAGSAGYISSPDGDRNASTKLPTTTPNGVRFDFVNASTAGTSGNYAGVMTYAPWTGTTASTGDASYQLAFGSTAINGGGMPMLNIRKGIDSTWNSWYTIIHSGNIASQSVNYANSAGNLSTNRTNWSSNGTVSAVVGQLSWKNYGNNHTIFDASASTSPDGTSVNSTNAQIAWSASYPTLMGWNGEKTYGVRVDSSRISDSAGSLSTNNGKTGKESRLYRSDSETSYGYYIRHYWTGNSNGWRITASNDVGDEQNNIHRVSVDKSDYADYANDSGAVGGWTLEDIFRAMDELVPSGSIMAFNKTSCPAGWIPCDGTNGTLDLRGVFLRGVGTPVGYYDTSGSHALGTKQDDALQNITGKMGGVAAFNYHEYNGAFQLGSAWSDMPRPSGESMYQVTFDAGRVARTDTETRPKNVAVLYCQKN